MQMMLMNASLFFITNMDCYRLPPLQESRPEIPRY